MGNFLEMIDRYKFGLLAALATYIGVFIYLQLQSYTQYYPIEPFHEGPMVEIPEDEIKLRPENIMVGDFNGDVKNISRDVNDSREKSDEEYYQNQSPEQIAVDYKALEQQMFDEAGGDKTRAEIRKEMADRKEALDKQKATEPKQSQKGGDKVFSGNVMVDWSLPKRDAHQKNNWFVRNPGYTCGHGASGRVTVMIKVNQNGNVTSAVYDAAQSSGASACMIEQAVKYAQMSRFNYSGSAAKIQPGRITYTFISQ